MYVCVCVRVCVCVCVCVCVIDRLPDDLKRLTHITHENSP